MAASITYKEALAAKGYTMTDKCGCGGTPTETFSLNQNKFVVKPKKDIATHYVSNKSIKTMMPFEIPKYLDKI